MESCDGLIGLSEQELVRRLGSPSARRAAGPDVWLVYRFGDVGLRVRLGGPDRLRLASWTASFTPGFLRLSEAAHAVGLWPAASPDDDARQVTQPLVRRALAGAEPGVLHSLTATVRGGRFTAISVFDEPPDWL